MGKTVTIKNPTDFANALLGALNKPDTKSNVALIVGWETTEGGNWHNPDKFNPINMTQPEPGSHGTNSAGVQAYTSWQEGLDATVQTLSASNYGYPNILAALDSGTATWNDFTRAISESGMGGIPKASNNYIGTPSILNYKTNPAGSSGGNPDAQSYATGAGAAVASTASTTGTTDTSKPSTGTTPSAMSGMAGILQAMDGLYQPPTPGFIASITSLGTANISEVATMIFVRATSALLMVGIIAMGIKTLSSGGSNDGGGATNVLEFVNNAKVQNRKFAQSEERVAANVTKEAGVASRHESSLASKERIAATPRTSHIYHHAEKPKVKVKWYKNPSPV